MTTDLNRLAAILAENQKEILDAWIEGQLADSRINTRLITREELTRQSERFLSTLIEALGAADWEDLDAEVFAQLRSVLADISVQRERLGLRAAGTAASILSLKDYWLPYVQAEYRDDPEAQTSASTTIFRLIDTLALKSYDYLVARREATITEQAQELMEVSTPVVQVWQGVVAAPLIGMLDSERTQRFMERLLQRIVETNSPVALVDITGVPAIDTQTAQHLIDTINAVKLLGSQVILTGVRPSIAQTLVHLGISLSGVRTRASFAAGLRVAIEILGMELPGSKDS